MQPLSFKLSLEKIKAAGLFRTRQAIASPQAAVVSVGGERRVNFCSNDYLGLANDERLVCALQQGAQEYGVGSGGSQLLSGRSLAHQSLEEAVAQKLGRARALVFSSGYLANLAIMQTFVSGRDEVIIMDKHNHTSLIDGALLSRAKLKRYPHNNIKMMEGLCADGATLVATDGVFSMDGDIAPLPGIVRACEKHHVLLAVDDAHGFGVLGAGGGGTLEHYCLDEKQAPVLMATFGKSCGAMGAFVAGSDDVIEMIIQKGRSYIYTTALPPAIAVVAKRALGIITEEGWRREKLTRLISRFREGAEQLGLPTVDSVTPIQALILGSAEAAVKGSAYLKDKGLLVNGIRSPTVPKNTERLRITLTTGHTSTQVDQLLEGLAGLKTMLNLKARP